MFNIHISTRCATLYDTSFCVDISVKALQWAKIINYFQSTKWMQDYFIKKEHNRNTIGTVLSVFKKIPTGFNSR